MHEQWKKRKMFSNREQGIMSGLDPVPMVQGGYVPYPGIDFGIEVPYPGIDMGGIVPPHTHPEYVRRAEGKDLGPNALLLGGPKMQTGGVVPQPQLFEEGDAEVNDALNSLASITKPDVPDMPIPMMDEKVEVKEEVTEDQGPDGYRKAVDELKVNFREEIKSYVAKSGGEDLETYLKNMGRLYRSKLAELKEKYRVTEYSPDEELISKDFLEEIIPGMTTGTLVYSPEEIAKAKEIVDSLGINLTPQEFLSLPADQQEDFKNVFLVQKAQMTGTPTSATLDTTNLTNLLKERRALAGEAGRAARANVATVGSPSGRYLAGLAAGRAAETAALDKALAGEIDLETALINAQARAGSGTNMPKLTEYQRNLLTGRDDDVSGLDDEFYEKAYTDLLKPDTYGKVRSASDALAIFVSLYRKVPPSRAAEFLGKKDIGGVPVSFENFLSSLYRTKPELTRDELQQQILTWLKAPPAT